MPDFEGEERCVQLVLEWLRLRTKSGWSDVGNPEKDLDWAGKKPDRLLGDGRRVAAVEIKRVVGSRANREADQAFRSQYVDLTPSCGGAYWLRPPATMSAFWPKALMKRVAQAIELKAPHLKPGDDDLIEIERRATLELLNPHSRGMVLCDHDQAPDLFSSALRGREGSYFLRDGEEGFRWPHSLLSEAAVAVLEARLLEACTTAGVLKSCLTTWYEEWPIRMLSEGSGVTVSRWHVEWVGSGVVEQVNEALQAAAAKFQGLDGALATAVIDRRGSSDANRQELSEVWPFITVPPRLDLVLLVDGGAIDVLFERPSIFDF